MSQLSWSTCSLALCLATLSAGAVRADEGNATENPTPPPAATTDSHPVDGAPANAPAAPSAPDADAEAAIAAASDESRATTQVASFAPTQLKDSPAVVTVISGEDIRSTGARDLIDILYLVPGYFIGVDTQGVVGPGFRGMWGHEGKILLMIDGKEMNELLFSSMQLGNEFPVELIERVEVVRGPGSVIYGGSAELSVINVVTRGLQGSTDLTANATYGQMTGAKDFGDGFGRRRLTVSGRYVFEAVPGLSTFASVSLGQGQRSVRTYTDTGDPQATPVRLPASRSMEGASALDPSVVQAGIGYRDIQASFLYYRMGTTSITGFGQTILPPAAPEPVNFDAFHGELVGTFRPNSRLEIVPRFNLTYQRPWHAPNADGDFFYDKSVRRLRGRVLGRWAAIDGLQITAGGDAIFDNAKLLTLIPDPAMPPGLQTTFNGANDISYQTYGTYIELFSENPIVNVAAGARYDHLSTIGGALVPRLVLLRSFGPLSLKGLYSQSFREPGIENINLGSNLHSERTRIFEFEATVDVTPEQRISANAFDVLISSPIAYAVDPATETEAYRNLGQQGTHGIEVSYRLRLPVVRMEANYSYYRPTHADNTPTYTVPGHPEQFLAAPAHHASVRATFRLWDQVGISPTAIIMGERFTRGVPDATGAETAVALPATVLANLFVYRDNVGVRGLTLGVGFYNIFNADFKYVHASAATTIGADHAPMPALDREVLVRLAYSIEP
jgi:outer membrane receptor protein involved in Fe transport